MKVRLQPPGAPAVTPRPAPVPMALRVMVPALALAFALVVGSGALRGQGAAPAAASDTGGFSTATGSAEDPVPVETLAGLQAAVAAGRTHIVVTGLIAAPALVTLTFRTPAWDNTTIEGAPGGRACLENIQLKFDGEQLPAGANLSNIVVRNLALRGSIPTLQALPQQVFGTLNRTGINYLGVSFRRCTNVWVTHCSICDTSDDLFCVTQASDLVTISHCHFFFTGAWVGMRPDPLWAWISPTAFNDLANERLAAVLGRNRTDSYRYGGGHLRITLHHDWFGPNLRGRPLCRGFVHAYDNFFDNTGGPDGKSAAGYPSRQYNALQIGSGCAVYAENNLYRLTNNSNRLGLDRPSDAWSFFERGNVYEGTTGKSQPGAPFPAASPFPYACAPAPAAGLPALLAAEAGPR